MKHQTRDTQPSMSTAAGRSTFRVRSSVLFGILASMIAGCSRSSQVPVPGTFVSREQLADVGFGAPEATFETSTWALMNGKYDRWVAALAPEFQADLHPNPSDGDEFAMRSKKDAPSFVGYRIVAEKKLGTNQVDLKFLMQGKDGRRTFSLHDSGVSGFGLQLMVKVGDEWKVAGGFRGYEAGWDGTNVIAFNRP